MNRTKNKFVTIVTAAALASVFALGLAGCGGNGGGEAAAAENDAAAAAAAGDAATGDAAGGPVTLLADASLTPHQEILEYAAPALLEKGVVVKVVTDEGSGVQNELLAAGEIDFNYIQHEPYQNSWNEQNGGTLVNAGDIHVEPITAYSDKYASKDEIKPNDVVAIPSDPTNEYRALRVLEENGFIVLDPGAKDSLSASKADITEYKVPLEIIELDSAQIIPTKDDYDFFFTNTNKALEANLTSNRLFSEGSDSPYANIITVRDGDQNRPEIKALVEVLQSDDVQNWISEHYNGAVIPAIKK